jgi:sulfur-carrier protein
MARVFFTTNLRRHVDLAEADAEGATVREVLADVFAREARIGGYVLDDQGGLRKHMAIIVDGRSLKDRVQLSDPVSPASQIYVFQALSGG